MILTLKISPSPNDHHGDGGELDDDVGGGNEV